MIRPLETHLARIQEALEAMRPQYFIICTKGSKEFATTLSEAI